MTAQESPRLVARRRTAWLVCVVLLCACAVRLWRLDAKSLWWDESLSLYRAQQPANIILAGRIDFPGAQTHDQHPPLYFLLLSATRALAGESDFALRLPSALLAVLLVPLHYALAARLFGRRVGLLAAGLAAASPFYLWYAQEARMYTLVTALTLATTHNLWRATGPRGPATGRRWPWAAGAAVCAAAALWTHYLTLLLLPFWAALVVLRWPWGTPWRPRAAADGRPRRPWWARALLALGMLALAGVLALTAWRIPSLLPAPGVYDQFVPLPEMLVDALNSFSLGLSVPLRQGWPWLLPVGALALLGAAWAWARPERDSHRLRLARTWVVCGYLLVPVLVIWAISHRVPFYVNSRYLMASSPAFYLAVALGLDALARLRRPLGWIALAAVVAGMGYSTQRYFYDPYYASKEDYRGAARAIESAEGVDEIIVLTGPESLPALAHYYRGRLEILTLPLGPTPADVLEGQLSALTARYRRIWHVQARSAFSDPDARARQWLEAHTRTDVELLLPSSGFYISVRGYLPGPFQVPAPAETLLRWSDGLRLGHYAIRSRSSAGAARMLAVNAARWASAAERMLDVEAGAALATTFTWGVDGPLPALKLSLRLTQGETVVAQRDGPPITGFDTQRWPVGRGMEHAALLTIPADTPPGMYTLRALLYDAETGAPYGDAVAQGGAPLATIRVLPGDPARPALPPTEAHRPLLRAVFGGQIELTAVSPTRIEAQPGQALSLHLYWRALRPLDAQAVQLAWQGPDGRVWHSASYPLSGLPADEPTTWPTGARLHAIVPLVVPAEAAAGRHRVHVLLLAADGRYLPLRLGPLPFAGRDYVVMQVDVNR